MFVKAGCARSAEQSHSIFQKPIPVHPAAGGEARKAAERSAIVKWR
jgi:hypothetical protein